MGRLGKGGEVGKTWGRGEVGTRGIEEDAGVRLSVFNRVLNVGCLGLPMNHLPTQGSVICHPMLLDG